MVRALTLGVTRWLATHDLAEQSLVFRGEVAERVAEQLDCEPPSDAILDKLPPSERNRLTANAQLLMEAWFHRRALQYAGLAGHEEKTRFVDAQIARTERWGIARFVTGDERRDEQGGMLNQELVRTVERWVERAPADRQPLLRDLLLAVQQHYALRLLRNL
jgi:hypothetical protein